MLMQLMPLSIFPKNVKLMGILMITYNQLPGLLKDLRWNLYYNFLYC